MVCHVVLCGWLRAQPKHVGKIARWYEGHGHTVTQLLTPADGLVPSRMRQHAAAAVAGLGAHDHANSEALPLLFHCFSGHGAILHALMVSEMHTGAPLGAGAAAAAALGRHCHSSGGDDGSGDGVRGLGQRHVGTIYDSVPARCDGPQLVRGVGSVLGQQGAALRWLLLAPLRAAVAAAGAVRPAWVPATEAAYRQGFSTLLARGVPQLFVHSDADEVCPMAQLLALHAELGREEEEEEEDSSGTLVQLLRFASSQHVTHWRDEHEAYTAAVEQFVGEAVERDSVAWQGFRAICGSS
jgi:hypothetical protein